MHILLLSQYFPPETGATQNRLSAFARACEEEGIELTVLTAMPHYQAGAIYPEYRGRWFLRERDGNAKILRAWVATSRHSGKWARLFSYLSFAVSSLLVGWWHVRQIDCVLWDSPPLVLGMTAYLFSKLKKAALVTNVADLWPESLVALDALPDGFAARALTRLEEFLYRESTIISGQTQAIVDDIRGRAGDSKPLILWRNGGIATATEPETRVRVRTDWGLSADCFVVGYAGLFGITQGLSTIVEAARMCPTNVQFVMVGDGPTRADLQHCCDTLGLTNITWIPRQPHDAMPGVWSAFDCAIVCLRDIPLFRGAVPSKLFEAMGAGVPIILGVQGEAQTILSETEAGMAFEPENPASLRTAIESLRQNPDLRLRLGENGQKSVQKTYDRSLLTRQYVHALRQALKERCDVS